MSSSLDQETIRAKAADSYPDSAGLPNAATSASKRRGRVFGYKGVHGSGPPGVWIPGPRACYRTLRGRLCVATSDSLPVEEIWINEPGRVFVAGRGCSELTTTILTADEIRDLVERMLRSSGRRVDVSTPCDCA
jgi:hypothetical protein